MDKRRLWILGVCGITAVLIIVLLTDAMPHLRGPLPGSSVWHWPYQLRPFSRWWLVILAGAAFLAVLGWWLRQEKVARWQTAITLILLFASCLGMQWGLLYADRAQPLAELVDRTLAVKTNGYYWTAANLDDVNSTLQNYPAAMPQFESDHARTHPPGLVLLNWFTIQLLQSTPELAQELGQRIYPQRCTDLWLLEQPPAIVATLGIWAILPMILAASTIFPTYFVAKNLTANPRAAKLTVVIAAIPALLIFAPLSDQLFALLTVLIVGTFLLGWQRQSGVWLFVSGLLLSFTTFLSIGNGTLVGVLGIYAVITLWQTQWSIRQHVLPLAVFGLGTILVWLIFWLGWQAPPWEIVQVGLAQHYELVTAKRSYGTWLLFNLVDVLIFTGLPIIAAFLSTLIVATRNFRRRQLTPMQALAVSTAVLLLILNLSGSTRGEVGRIWLFLMPLLLIPSATWLAKWLPNWRWQWLWAAGQLSWAIALGLSWRPVGATIVAINEPLIPSLPNEAENVNVLLGDQIELTQFALKQSANALDLTLVWQAENPTVRPYTVFNHLLDSQGNLVAQADGWPVNGQWPPTCWQSSDPVVDQHQISLPADLPAGSYMLYTGLYDVRDGTRLITPTGQDAILIRQIELPE
ncbi:hypothetical protein [Candidatus Leptofilum sp.]|uniref:hypothetical protein n=1 Tax=Candidatus Leptofilum sp. TaxID=3241576 RepID=UPI003B5BBA26